MPRIPALPSYRQPEGCEAWWTWHLCIFHRRCAGFPDSVLSFSSFCLCEKDRFGKISVIGCGQHGGAVDDQKFGHNCSPSMIIWQFPNEALIFTHCQEVSFQYLIWYQTCNFSQFLCKYTINLSHLKNFQKFFSDFVLFLSLVFVYIVKGAENKIISEFPLLRRMRRYSMKK